MSRYRKYRQRKNVGRPGKIFIRRHLMLSHEYANLLLSGIKKATVRLGLVVPKYDEVIIHSGGRPIAKAKIVGVEYKKVHQLTDEDAKLDGFSSVDELIDALRRTYGNIDDGSDVSIIKLEVIQRFDDLRNHDPYYGLNPSDIARIGMRYLKNELSDEEKRVLELLSKELSIRRAAVKLYGSPDRRSKIRRIVRRVLGELRRRGIVRVSENLEDHTTVGEVQL
ncbi:MAG: ASCH domain-containing protein [Sulfolobales archaeon]